MEQSPSWEANRLSASQEISRVLWNPKVHYRTIIIIIIIIMYYFFPYSLSYIIWREHYLWN
jgi:hypothetical protein